MYFPKQDPRSGGTIYIPIFGPQRTPHLVARDQGHEEVSQFLMERSPEDLKLAQACELGDEGAFRELLAARPNLVETLSDDDCRRLPDAAQNNNAAAVRLMLAAGWPVDACGEYQMTPLQWASWHGNAEMVREILRYHPKLELSCQHEITALGPRSTAPKIAGTGRRETMLPRWRHCWMRVRRRRNSPTIWKPVSPSARSSGNGTYEKAPA